MEHRRVRVTAGSIELRIDRSDIDFDRLCGFASRRNPKRGFLFVSRVLGKHVPVDPREIEETFSCMAAKLSITDGPTVFIGLAETATGLAQGVYEHYLTNAPAADAIYLHTTRRRFQRPLLTEFLEPHSHAPQHRVYLPHDPSDLAMLRAARSLVLIDDELSTGVTLSNLAAALMRDLPHLHELHIVSLKNWLDDQAYENFRKRVGDVRVEFHSLMRGSFRFHPDAEFHPSVPISPVRQEIDFDDLIPGNYGRFGQRGALTMPSAIERFTVGLDATARILVLGTGEFLYPPYLFARELVRQGFDVRFQSTTRSPVFQDGDIRSTFEFVDREYEDVASYVYNVTDKTYARIFIGYEIGLPEPACRLSKSLGAVPIFFPDASSMPRPIACPSCESLGTIA